MYAVIFTRRMGADSAGYDEIAARMVELAESQAGYISHHSAGGEELGVTISYWEDLESIKAWKANGEHLEAQRQGRLKFYSSFSLQVCKVEKSYSHGSADFHPRDLS